MPSLSKDLRNLLARTTLHAREQAEQAVRAALENLAVHEREYRPHMGVEQRLLRNRLRARGRAAGDERDANGNQRLEHLVADAAYEHWHRLLFTRFLTENNLLRTDAANGYVPVTLADCDELAPELAARNGFELACRFAGQILPGVFRSDDPVLELRLAPNDEVALKTLLDELPIEVFTADDSLGWTYQFWQAKRKDEVNASGKKIGADEISPVTQLFTEDYMVDFLLHNTLGAWWAGKQDPIHAATEADARRSVALPERDGMPAIEWAYLRFVQDEVTKTWSPAAGTFEGWPKEAKAITMLDPCMGSGHFLVFALPIIARLRMEEEGLSAQQAVAAALRDNIHGLELDPRCTQIGAFNVALTAWKLAGFQQLPAPHIACSGLAPQAKLADWVKLAGDDVRMQEGMKRLYELFEQAPILGSLIDPKLKWDLMGSGYDELAPLLEKALINDKADDALHEMAVTAKGIALAAKLLSAQFTIVLTNVPYLGRGKQDEVMQDHCDKVYPSAKADLATCFVERCLSLSHVGWGVISLVTPQNWLFLKRYRRLRESALTQSTINSIARLGAGAFETIGGEVVNVALYTATNNKGSQIHRISSVSVEQIQALSSKTVGLVKEPVKLLIQADQMKNTDAAILTEDFGDSRLLKDYADSYQGIGTSDNAQFLLTFWEQTFLTEQWRTVQTAAGGSGIVGGLHFVLPWEGGQGRYYRHAMALKAEGRLGGWKSGGEAWGKTGIAVNVTSSQFANLYGGDLFDTTVGVIVPRRQADASAIFAYVHDVSYLANLRIVDQTLSITEHTLLKVPFDLAHWQKVAAEKYPNGLPKPHSDDPTQWLFNGHPKGSEETLHVAVARLLNYRWPRQTGSTFPDCPALGPDGLEALADKDGIVCLPPINQEQPAAARLRQLLATALDTYDERSLITAAGGKATTFEDWLRDEFFEQHCRLFHHRPFVWHIWDGRKDGFHALVNYHQLDHAALQKLTYSYLGDWIRVQEEGAKADKPGAAERLGAAQMLQKELAKILEGETPYDLFVRWKPLSQQAIGWHPDINDGVRLNIRPFLTATDVGKKGAGILRWKPNIKWDKDRGAEPQRAKAEYPWFWCEEEPGKDPEGGKTFTGNRWNGVHLTLARKRHAQG
jgi:hypothetical protein